MHIYMRVRTLYNSSKVLIHTSTWTCLCNKINCRRQVAVSASICMFMYKINFDIYLFFDLSLKDVLLKALLPFFNNTHPKVFIHVTPSSPLAASGRLAAAAVGLLRQLIQKRPICFGCGFGSCSSLQLPNPKP